MRRLRRPAAGQDLGDFVSFDDIAPLAQPQQAASSSAAAGSSSSTAWQPTRRYSGNLAPLLLHEELLDFWHAFRPTRAELAARRDLIKRLEAVVSTVWPEASVRAFGSYDTGLFLPESDIDIVCLDTGVHTKQRGTALHKLARALRRAEWPISEMEVVDKARVPIIKFVDGQSGIPVDICLEERSGLSSSDLTRKAARQFPAFSTLVLFLKRFLNARGLHDTFTGGIGSFLLTLMVIAALQHPPSEETQKHKGATKTRGNLGIELLHFFEVFGLRLNYEAVGISLADGGKFFRKPRARLENGKAHHLCIENPLDRSHDVGANSYNILSVRRVFQHGRLCIA